MYRYTSNMCRLAKRVHFMNATVFENNIMDIYYQMDMLDSELLPSKSAIDKKFSVYKRTGYYYKKNSAGVAERKMKFDRVGYKNQEIFKESLKLVYFARTIEDKAIREELGKKEDNNKYYVYEVEPTIAQTIAINDGYRYNEVLNSPANVDPAAGSGVIGVLSMLWNIYGQLFEATPTALRGWLQCRNVMSTDTKEQEATIRIALGTWSPAPDHDVKIPEHPVVDQYLEEALDPSCSDLIAYGELQVAEDVDWQQFTIPLEYLRTDRKPTHLIIACDAGSRILCLDDFELLYDYNF